MGFINTAQLRQIPGKRMGAITLTDRVSWVTATIRPEKRRWDMPRSQSNPVLETWAHADLAVPIRSSISKLQQMCIGRHAKLKTKEGPR
jgi:hypothetical protein